MNYIFTGDIYEDFVFTHKLATYLTTGDVVARVGLVGCALESGIPWSCRVRTTVRVTVSISLYMSPVHIILCARACVLQWEVCVSAADGGGRSSTVTVTLNVVDVNDSPPRFTQSAYTFGTYENQPPDTEIGRLAAVDADRPPHDRHVFAVVAEVCTCHLLLLRGN